MVRPVRRRVKFCETAERMVPSVKDATAVRRTSLRPKMSDEREKIGWKTHDATRKDVPVQKASVAVPPRSLEMVYRTYQGLGLESYTRYA
jgi:hypothetical protein